MTYNEEEVLSIIQSSSMKSMKDMSSMPTVCVVCC